VTSVSTNGSRGVTAARPDLHHSGDKAGQEEQMTRVDLYQEAQARLREFFARVGYSFPNFSACPHHLLVHVAEIFPPTCAR